MGERVMDDALRRKNVRTAWILAAFVLLILLSAVPFWRGLFRLITAAGGG
jgi:hypothetical protein